MSSLRNAVGRRNHRERAQPRSRQKLGILEKHKDYALRATDYKDKQKRLKVLRQKASERNPDEFHFGMMSSRTDEAGRKVQPRGGVLLSASAANLYKTQDSNYLRTMISKTTKDIERLKERITLDDALVLSDAVLSPSLSHAGGMGTKTLFTEDRHDQVVVSSDLTTQRSHSSLNDQNDFGSLGKVPPSRQRSRLNKWKGTKLESLQAREHDLTSASSAVDLQRSRMRDSVGGETKNGRIFKIRGRKR